MASSTNPLASALAMPAGVDPSDYQAILDSQRKQMLAQALTQRALSGFDAPQPISGGKYTVAPRAGLVTALRPLADALAGNKASKDAGSSQAAALAQMANAYAPGGQPIAGTPLQAAQPPSDPNAQSVQPGVQRLPGQSLATTVQASMPSTTPINPRNPQGLPAQAVMQLAMSNPEAYTKYLQGTPDYQNALTAAGGDPNLARQLLMAEAQKKGSLDLRQGGEVVMPNGQIYRNPTLGAGQVLQRDANGNPVAVQNLPGYTEAAAASAGATTGAQRAAEAPYQYQNVPTQGGGSVPMSIAQLQARQGQPSYGPPAPGAPPAGAPPSSSAQAFPPSRQYFPPPQQNAGPQRAPASAAGSRDPFPNAPRPPVYGGVGAPGTTDAVIQKARGEKQAELYSRFGGESDLADQQLTRIQEAQRVIGNANMGPWSEKFTHVQGVLHEIAPSIFDGEAATNTQIANKNLVNLALQGAKAVYGPRMTASEVNLQLNHASPSAEQTQEAASMLLKQSAVIAQYNRQRANDYQTYVENGHDPLRFEGWYSANHPLSQYAIDHDPARQAQLAAEDAQRNGTAPPPAPTQLNDLPPAAAYRGRTLTDNNTGQRLVSDGQSWKPVQRGASGSW